MTQISAVLINMAQISAVLVNWTQSAVLVNRTQISAVLTNKSERSAVLVRAVSCPRCQLFKSKRKETQVVLSNQADVFCIGQQQRWLVSSLARNGINISYCFVLYVVVTSCSVVGSVWCMLSTRILKVCVFVHVCVCVFVCA